MKLINLSYALFLPLFVLADEETLVLHTSGKKRQAAQESSRQVTQDTDHHDNLELKTGEDLGKKCKKHGQKCWTDGNCCGKEMECLGVKSWKCGYTPGRIGEYCNLFYYCTEDLLCHYNNCIEYKDVLAQGKKGTCTKNKSSGDQLTIMSYNIFLLGCSWAKKQLGLTCDYHNNQKKRMDRLAAWMKSRDEDVVIFQEMFRLREDIISGMSEAGYCYYVSTPWEATGSGMAIFSRYPIEKIDFMDWFDYTGPGEDVGANPEATADKGIMYAKIKKNGTYWNVFDLHTQSDSVDDEHEKRFKQAEISRIFIEEMKIPKKEMILIGGDFNEDKYTHHEDRKEYFHNLKQEFNAKEIAVTGKNKYSYDTEANPFFETLLAKRRLSRTFGFYHDLQWRSKIKKVFLQHYSSHMA